MIANRWNPLGAKVKKATAQDYIQDGLIAMYDGIENAGWGVHDADATAWKDLVGTRDLPIAKSGVTFGDNCAVFVGKFIEERSGPLNSYQKEAVFKSSTNGTIVFTEMRTGHRLWVKDGQISNTYYFQDYNIVYDWLNKRLAVSLSNSNTQANKYVNGQPAENFINKSLTGEWDDNNGVKVGKGINGEINCIRIYNRTLTAEEVAHNYGIDKERFGL